MAATSAAPVQNVIRVIVIDDQPLVRQGMASVLALEPGVLVVAQGASGAEALTLAHTVDADVILMDIRMPGLNGIDATREIAASGGPPVILITTFENADEMIAGIQAGAAGYLFKNAEVEDIAQAMRAVVAGEHVFDPKVVATMAEHLKGPVGPGRDHSDEALTGREVEVLRALAQGLSNKKIGQSLSISESTVKIHVSNIFSKLGARNRMQAVLIARREGRLPPDPPM